MKVIGIMASPFKQGNSALLLEKAAEGCKSKGVEVEIINLIDEPLPPCIGCLACKEGDTLCVPSPEINVLLKKIKDADALIISTPVWWLSVSSYLKLLLDHFVVFFDLDFNSAIQGKKVAAIAVSGGGENAGTKDTITMLKKGLGFLGLEWVGDLRVVDARKHGEVTNNKDALKKAYEIGEKICSP